MQNDPKPNEAALNQCLRQWRIDVPLPPRFQEQVWRRIEQENSGRRTTLWALFRQSMIERLLVHRAWALCYLVIALLVGSSLGFWQARTENKSVAASLSQRYVQSIDPYQKNRN